MLCHDADQNDVLHVLNYSTAYFLYFNYNRIGLSYSSKSTLIMITV